MKTRITAKMLLLSCEIFSNWQRRILPLRQWKSGLLFADTLKVEYMSREHEMASVMERILINADIDNNHAEDLLVHVSLTDCKILKIAYKPSLKDGKLKINFYQI